MNYLSVCSGIEAASVAWRPLGWEPVAFSEIEAFPSAVLAHRYPKTPNLGDLTNYHEWPNTLRPDLIVGGTPCQSFSVAGLRRGLADPRGNLTLVFLGLLERLRPRWVVWENVPGVLSDRTGAFGALLGGLGELGYGFAYRVLDAQYFGVAQRRRRVFVVVHLGDWRAAAAVLFEPESLSGDSPPRREAGERAAQIAAKGVGIGSHWDGVGFPHPTLNQSHNAGGIGASNQELFSRRGCGLVPDVAHAQRGEGFDGSEDGTGPLDTDGSTQAVVFNLRGRDGGAMPEVDRDGLACQRAASGGSSRSYVAFTQNQRDEVRTVKVAGALAAEPGMKQQTYLATPMAVRRLTPRECERLQGFPDDYTRISYRGKPAEECPDGPRYKALGNSMAVPVMRWIGRRIESLNQEA